MRALKAKLKMTDHQWDRLGAHLLRDDTREHAAFAMAGAHQAKGQLILTVKEIIPIDDSGLIGGPSAQSIEIQPSALLAVVNKAIKENLLLVEFHNHPPFGGRIFADFSFADEQGFRETVPYMLSSLPRRTYAAVVVADPKNAKGVVWQDTFESRICLGEIEVVGRHGRRIVNLEKHSPKRISRFGDPLSQFDRQVRAFGAEGQQHLSEIAVAIVGLGGIGSIVAAFLAHTGIGRFVLIDLDVVDRTSRNRLLGSTLGDALGASPKVAVAARQILVANPNAIVEAIHGNCFSPQAIKAIATTDLILGGTDDVASRFALNDMSLAYLIPYLDLATEIYVAEDKTLQMAGGRYTFCFPGSGCLLCAKAIDAAEAASEFTPAAVRETQRRAGYITNADEPAPSVLGLNAVPVSLAVNEVIAWATSMRPVNPQMIYDMLRPSVANVEFSADPKCDRCLELLGGGSYASMETRYQRWAG